MADDSSEGEIGLRFREDILRGVRLFAIAFAAILVCVAAYRMLRAPSDVQGAPPEAAAPSDATAQPSPEASPEAPSSQAASEVHPLVVPAPPPVAGKRAPHPRNYDDVPPPPPPNGVRAKRQQSPSGREFESSDSPVILPAAPPEDAPESKPLTPKQAVGYKSLIEVNANRPPPDPTAAPVPGEEPNAKAAKGNRFFRAIGKIFHPTDKKDDAPAKQP
jgi:hypothetical protein